jgi:acetoin utilization deacetylase AcuC-like enzyme
MSPRSAAMPLYFHPLYTDGIAPEARFPRERYRRIAARLEDHGDKISIYEAPAASDSEISIAHDPSYVTRFLSGQMEEPERRRIGLRPWTDLLIPRTRHLIGGAIAALNDVLRDGGVAANMAGGTHHAHYDWGAGYCVFNDLAICARLAVQRHGVSRVAIVDLDVHQGDGTATILAKDPEIFTLSVHCAHNFPMTKSISDLDVALPIDTEDAAYLDAVTSALDMVWRTEPELILFQAGVDPLKDDRLGRLAITREGLKRRNRLVFDAICERDLPCVVFMGGGYCKPIDPTIDAFVDLFEQAAEAHAAMSTG